MSEKANKELTNQSQTLKLNESSDQNEFERQTTENLSKKVQ